MNRPAVFIDKDGTLIDDIPYNVDPWKMRLAPGAAAGLRQMARAGFDLYVVTNQSGVGRGYFPESALVAVERRLAEIVNEAGAALSGFYYCATHLQPRRRSHPAPVASPSQAWC
jgi:D-glycero-D-manno-heptose 1,7-bisphosphate phosphatase